MKKINIPKNKKTITFLPNQSINMSKKKQEIAREKTKRTARLTTALNPKVHDILKKIAYQKKCKLIDVIEEGIKLVEKNSVKSELPPPK